jgi:hypothetical protein
MTEKKRLVVPHGRPLYFPACGDPDVLYLCACCLRYGITVKYRLRDLYMNDPACNPWGNSSDTGVYYVCRYHVPKNAVIYNPVDRTLRDKRGDIVSG